MVCNSHRPQRHCSCPRLLGLNFTLPPTALSRHVWLADSLDSGCQSKLSVLTAEPAGDGRRGVFSVILHGKVDWISCCRAFCWLTRSYPIMCGQLICVLDYTSLFWLGPVTLIALKIYRECVFVSVCDRNTVMKMVYESSDADWFIY